MERLLKIQTSQLAFLCLIIGANLTGCTSNAPVVDPTDALNQDGNQLLKDNKYIDAIDKFSQVIELKPTLAQGYTKRAEAEAAVHQSDKALNDANKSISLDHTDGEAFYTRGLLYYEKGDNKATYEDLQKAAGLYLKAGKKEECDKVVRKLDELSGVQHQ